MTPKKYKQPVKAKIKVLKHLQSLSHLLDNSISIPRTSWLIGIDPIVGLIPGIGDYIGAAVSTYIMLKAAELGTPQPILYRMALNIIIDTLFGTIPLLGDSFDAAWKANAKNVALLEAFLSSSQRPEKANGVFLGSLLFGLMLVIICVTAFTVIMFRFLLNTIFG